MPLSVSGFKGQVCNSSLETGVFQLKLFHTLYLVYLQAAIRVMSPVKQPALYVMMPLVMSHHNKGSSAEKGEVRAIVAGWGCGVWPKPALPSTWPGSELPTPHPIESCRSLNTRVPGLLDPLAGVRRHVPGATLPQGETV